MGATQKWTIYQLRSLPTAKFVGGGAEVILKTTHYGKETDGMAHHKREDPMGE